MATEHRDVLLGGCELVHGNRHHIVGDFVLCVFVEVVTDPRAMGQQVFDGHVVADERELAAEQRTCPR